MEARRQAEIDREFKPVQRGWCVGSQQFRQDMLKHIEQQRGKWHYGPELGEATTAKAERLIRETLHAENVTEEQLVRWRKGHPFKIKLAVKLRGETTVTVNWLAQRLHMGSRGHLAHLLFTHEHAQTDYSGSADQIPFRI
jgi:hypothetical protein